MADHLVLFAKAPRLGRVKTRLARKIGDISAWAFYRHCLRQTLRRLGNDSRWKSWLAVTPDLSRSAPIWPQGWRVIGQGPGDLGGRMLRPLRDLPPGPVVIVGSDIPELGAAQVAAAFHKLGDHDAVFGPARDGGYWLVGLRRRPRLPRDLFANVHWSSPQALADTLANLQGYRVALLDPLSDVDDGADYGVWLKSRRISGR
ncbi:TIGR04282 family arsenosugar biosynthesis glycosyltransferase [Magnetospira thiophila]